ncbi:MAG: hypothetical protein HOE90_14535 [Bacteriovoracaceae bacterium]|jgi:uncharacterized protein YbjQ (UPF0145 family)|nr:hypothetical protein [Bacteriovoracaceae bacterium]
MSDDEDKSDLTRLEDIGEFLHESSKKEDEELDSSFQTSAEEESPPEFPIDDSQIDITSDDIVNEDQTESFIEGDFDINHFSDEEQDSDATEEKDISESLSFGEDGDNETFFESMSEDSDEQVAEIPSFEDDSDELNSFVDEGEEDDSGLFETQESILPNTEEFELENEESEFPEIPEEELQTEEFALETEVEIEVGVEDEDDYSIEENAIAIPPIDEDQQRGEVAEKTPIITTCPEPKPQKENLDELKEFANNLLIGDYSAPGNPPFSIIIRNVKYVEDLENIISLLKEHGLVGDENDEQVRSSLKRGSLLLSQLGEFNAIVLTHKLRKYDLDLHMGLGEELHTPQSYSDENKGLIGKRQLFTNTKDSATFSDDKSGIDSIIISSTSSLEGHQIERYIDMATEHLVIDHSEFEILEAKEDGDKDFGAYYQILAFKLKEKALKLGGNAIVGVAYQISPLVIENDEGIQNKYKLTSVGNIVWVN